MAEKHTHAAEREMALNQRMNAKLARKIKAQQKVSKTIWSGLGMMGLIGWAVVVPTLLGAALGIWIDHHHPGPRSWTLALLMLGLTLGCFNAWRWVDKEHQAIHKQDEEDE